MTGGDSEVLQRTWTEETKCSGVMRYTALSPKASRNGLEKASRRGSDVIYHIRSYITCKIYVRTYLSSKIEPLRPIDI